MAKEHILVVDDDPSGRYLLDTVFRAAGYEVATAPDGMAALDLARAGVPDLIITDILMPRMDGYQLCREWKADPRLAPVPFVFFTANYPDDDDEALALSLGTDAFLRKPMHPDDLVGVVDGILHGPEKPPLAWPTPVMEDETSVLKAYNTRLVSKLEDQLVELKATNEALRDIVSGTVRHRQVDRSP